MDNFLCDTPDHFLFGTLVVRAIRRKDRRPGAGLRVRIGASWTEACGKG